MNKDEIVQMKITLEGITPNIWRRFQVEKDITFHQLHRVIQEVMGWTDSHLYGFTVDKQEYQDDRDNELLDGKNVLSSQKHTITMLKLKQKFRYVYDFGDCWEHLLVVEKILSNNSAVLYPICLEGERNCPPEDCGSVPGYYDLMEIRKNKKHPDYEELIEEWLGEDYDPERFNAQEVNVELRCRFPKKGEKKPDGRARYWVKTK